MPALKLYGNLREFVERPTLEVAGETAGAVLDALCASNPALGDAIRSSDGELQPYVRVLVNGRDVTLAQGMATPVSEADQIAIFPPIAGG